MIIRYERRFKKQFRTLPVKLQDKFYDRVRIFVEDPNAPHLHIHPLKGAYGGYWSMNISGDLRVLYRQDGDEVIIFALIGTHSQLYG